jgi:2-oxoglutarate ferredoxin oxidoreductase subunit gamma
VKREIRITGLGGQGAITAGHILGRAAAIYDRKEAVMTEGYSPYVTGGWSRADLVISDDPIDFPLVSGIDALVAMYQEGLESNLSKVKANGVAISDSRLARTFESNHANRQRVLSVPAASTAENLGKKMLTNVVMLGSLQAIAPVVNIDSLKRSLVDRFPKAAELNIKAFDVGYELGLKASTELKISVG